MKRFLFPALVMLGVLILFFIFGGLPLPGDIQWDNRTWVYAGRDSGVIKYTYGKDSEFTIDLLPGNSFILGVNGQDYGASIDGQRVKIVFPDGRELSGTIVVFLEDVTRIIFTPPVQMSGTGNSIFYLAAEVGLVFKPKAGPIALALFFVILGMLYYGYPLAFARFELSFRAWMVKDSEPTEEYVVLTKILGGLFLIGGWIYLLTVIW